MFFDSYSDSKQGALASLILLGLCVTGGLIAATLFFCRCCCPQTERRSGMMDDGGPVIATGEETSLRNLKAELISGTRFITVPSSPKQKEESGVGAAPLSPVNT